MDMELEPDPRHPPLPLQVSGGPLRTADRLYRCWQNPGSTRQTRKKERSTASYCALIKADKVILNHKDYLNHSQVAVFGVSTKIKYIPLHINRGWRKKE